jgi:hypothetical protein
MSSQIVECRKRFAIAAYQWLISLRDDRPAGGSARIGHPNISSTFERYGTSGDSCVIAGSLTDGISIQVSLGSSASPTSWHPALVTTEESPFIELEWRNDGTRIFSPGKLLLL